MTSVMRWPPPHPSEMLEVYRRVVEDMVREAHSLAEVLGDEDSQVEVVEIGEKHVR